MTKKDLRQDLLTLLKNQDKSQKDRADRDLLTQVLADPHYQTAQTIASYLPLPFEYASQLLIDQALADGKQVVIPKILPDRQMVFAPYDPNQLELTRLGIWQPKSDLVIDKSQIDLIHVPGLAFNSQGYRLGFGGGYYDRYLADYQGWTLATAYHCQRRDFPVEVHDIPLRKIYYA